MNAFLRIGAIFIIALKRLFAERRLALLTAMGLMVAVALTLSVPLYADGVYGRTLSGSLLDKSTTNQESFPPFAFVFRQLAGAGKPAALENIQAADAYLSEQAARELRLPQKIGVRYLRTEPLYLFPQNLAVKDYTMRNNLGAYGIGSATDLENHVRITEGHFPAALPVANGQPVEVLVNTGNADKMGIQVGETYLFFHWDLGAGTTAVQIPVRVSGTWEARDAAEDYWFYKPWALADVFFVPESTYMGQVVPLLARPAAVAAWYLVLDGSAVQASDAAVLQDRIATVSQKAAALLPGLQMAVSPSEALKKYARASELLTILLFAFSVPVLGLVLAFITLVVGLTVSQQRNEIAVIRSRGGTTFQVVGIAALEAMVLDGLALALAWPLSQLCAQAMARTRSFLEFGPPADMPVRLSPLAVRYGLIMVAVVFVIQMIPTLGAARHTIITYKQERARTLRPPWWQRAWLDILLLVPTGYGMYLLRKQGTIATLPLPTGTTETHDPFQNPLLFLIPALGTFALTLVILRLLPLVMKALVWLMSRTRSVGFVLATRHLAGVPGSYAAPVLLLVLTLSLSAFTASLAQTLDGHLYDQSYYQVGADLKLAELGQTPENLGDRPTGDLNAVPTDQTGQWLFLPVAEHLKVPGIKAATRFAQYDANAVLGDGQVLGHYIGLDRLDYPNVAFWRRDFAARPLGYLMNSLASTPDAVLVAHDFMKKYGLKNGDSLRLDVGAAGTSIQVTLRIVDEFNLFPTYYPDEGPAFVGNLDYLFDQMGSELPYNVLLKLNGSHDYERIVKDVGALGVYVTDWQASLREIATEQRRPERQGLFGLLSVGFVAAALFTVLGFLLYAFFSFRRRMIELGILRVVGLSAGQMTSFLGWELIFLILTGMVAGTGLGALTSNLFIPYLQVGSGPAARVPPFLIEIAWPAIFRIYALFGLLFVVALAALAFLLMRLKIYQAIKLGDTV